MYSVRVLCTSANATGQGSCVGIGFPGCSRLLGVGVVVTDGEMAGAADGTSMYDSAATREMDGVTVGVTLCDAGSCVLRAPGDAAALDSGTCRLGCGAAEMEGNPVTDTEALTLADSLALLVGRSALEGCPI